MNGAARAQAVAETAAAQTARCPWQPGPDHPGAPSSSRDLTVAGYLVILLAGGLLQATARCTLLPVPSLGEVLTRIMPTRTGRVGVLVAWPGSGCTYSPARTLVSK